MSQLLLRILPLLAIAALLSFSPASAGQTSRLWGRSGEHWTPQSRLPDFSFAGYQRGERPIPQVEVAASIRDFGAVGDGKHDDTAAFQRAIAEVRHGAIEIPPGRYLITDILDIRRSNLVLRGAGPEKTTLCFPRFLNDIRPNMGQTTGGRPTSNYSWSGGFIWVRGSYESRQLAEITTPAQRGDTSLLLSSTTPLRVGQTIEIQQRDDDANSLAERLYAGQPGPTDKLLGRTRASLTCRITAIDGPRISIDRPLRFDIDLRWQPRILSFQPTVSHVGIEGLRFEFPILPYEGHFTELGHNAIAFQQVADCWARDIVIDHADSGIFCSGRYCTLENITLNSARAPDRLLRSTGHHGISLTGDDNLLTRFRFNTRFVHDITVSHCAGNVVSAGGGVDLCFDHHKRAPYANLLTDLDVGAGTRMWRCGGGDALGRHSAAWTTFWNIRSQQPQSWPPAAFGPDLMNLVGLHTDQPPLTDPQGKWFEPIPPQQLIPQNLHQSQLEQRLQRIAER